MSVFDTSGPRGTSNYRVAIIVGLSHSKTVNVIISLVKPAVKHNNNYSANQTEPSNGNELVKDKHQFLFTKNNTIKDLKNLFRPMS